jgi:hypothetical protein
VDFADMLSTAVLDVDDFCHPAVVNVATVADGLIPISRDLVAELCCGHRNRVRMEVAPVRPCGRRTTSL